MTIMFLDDISPFIPLQQLSSLVTLATKDLLPITTNDLNKWMRSMYSFGIWLSLS